MQANYDLLYITFIDINEPAKSGSSLRPKKMLEAFEQMQLKIKVLQGANNKRAQRRRNVKEILKWLDSNKPRMCYVEPPSGPFFCSIDLKLLKKLKKMEVPIGLFYRDVYWKYPKIYENINIIKKIKLIIIKQMQLRDLRVFERTLSIVFSSSESMFKALEIDQKYCMLPPGCIQCNLDFIDKDIERILNNQILTYLYVGGASVRYGSKLLLRAFEKVNRDKICAKLIFICPEQQWRILEFSSEASCKWLQVLHIHEEALAQIYKKADVCVSPILKNDYNDIVIPIKLYEYMSYAKPILATNCTETQRIIQSYDIGWITCDTVDALFEEIVRLNKNRSEIINKKKHIVGVIEKNTWSIRAQKVVNVLSNI